MSDVYSMGPASVDAMALLPEPLMPSLSPVGGVTAYAGRTLLFGQHTPRRYLDPRERYLVVPSTSTLDARSDSSSTTAHTPTSRAEFGCAMAAPAALTLGGDEPRYPHLLATHPQRSERAKDTMAAAVVGVVAPAGPKTPPRSVDDMAPPKLVDALVLTGTLSTASPYAAGAALPVSPTFSTASRSPTKLSHDAQPFYPQHNRFRVLSGAPARAPVPLVGVGRPPTGGAAYLHGHYSPTNLSSTAAPFSPPPACTAPRASPEVHAADGEDAMSASLPASLSAASHTPGTAGTSASHGTPPIALGEDEPELYMPARTPPPPSPAATQLEALRHAVTGAPIPVPERVVLVDSMHAFAAVEATCERLLCLAHQRGAPANRYCENLPCTAMDGEDEVFARDEDAELLSAASVHAWRPRPPAPGLADTEDFSLTVALDLEGRYLGRSGHLCILTFATAEVVYAIDMIMLPHEVLTMSAGTAFRQVLQSPRIVKLMFDCRADCETLYFQFGVRLQAVCDLQVAAGISLSGLGAKYLIGMEDAFARLGLFRDDERSTKSEGRRIFDARHGGDCECWEDRPLDPLLLRYCAVDVKHFFEAFYKLRSLAYPSSLWAAKRVSYVCRGTYDVQSRANARSDFRYSKWLLPNE